MERLQEIADDPSSTLETEEEEVASLDEEAPSPESIEVSEEELVFASEEPEAEASTSVAESVSQWKKDGLDPRSIEVGDIFSDHAGPILKKASSLADRLDLEDWAKTINSVAEQKGARVPVTLSVAELNALKDQSPLGTEFPTRSVALDFRTVTQRAKKNSLEKLYDLIENKPEGLTIEDEDALDTLAKDLGSVRSRLEEGAPLYVVTGVTLSDEMKATYPGAPLGSRDAELIQNAVTALYPHLDHLTADPGEQSVLITREPKIYWEFEIRELKVKDDKIVIDEESLAQI